MSFVCLLPGWEILAGTHILRWMCGQLPLLLPLTVTPQPLPAPRLQGTAARPSVVSPGALGKAACTHLPGRSPLSAGSICSSLPVRAAGNCSASPVSPWVPLWGP